jgi:iron(III) transport system substrate-binding protein
MTFIGDGDELVLAVHNSTADDPALCLASGGKIGNRDESGYNIGWCMGMAPYTGLENCEYMYVVEGGGNPAGARLFIRYITGGADGKSGGLKPFQKEGNWAVRDDVESKWNPASLEECGAVEGDLEGIAGDGEYQGSSTEIASYADVEAWKESNGKVMESVRTMMDGKTARTD